MRGREKWEIPEKTRRPAASSGTIPTCGNPGVARPGIEPGSPRWEASRLTAQPPRCCKYKRKRITMAVIFSWLITDIVFAMVACFVLSSLYYTHVFKYWKKRGVHYMEPSLFFGNFARVAMHRESAAEFLRKTYERTAGIPFVGMYAFSKPQLLVRDLKLLQRILVTDARVFLDNDFSPPEKVSPLLSKSVFVLKGRKWGHMRIKLTPTFTSGNIQNMFPEINMHSNKLVLCIDQEISKGNAVDVKDLVARFSTDTIASCVFGVDTNALAEPNCEFHLALLEVIEPGVVQKLVLALSLFLPWLLSVLGAVAFPGRVGEFVRMTLWDIVEHRKKSRTVRKDFGDLLMQITDQREEAQPEHSENSGGNSDSESDDDDMVTQAFVFILVSFETSASLITFALFELALNPAIQDRLRGEITSVLGKYSSQVTHDAIAKMTYLDMVVSETMRKYPILPSLERKCLSNYEVPGTNVTIEKGTPVMVSVLGIHSDPEIYPDPEKFDPERFNTENRRKRSRFAHLPIADGPRIRTGMQFGQMQVKTVLAHILRTFRVWPCRVTPKPPLKLRALHGPLSADKKILLAFTELSRTSADGRRFHNYSAFKLV
ncbi:hypothetical protein PR048_027500 [Dryococelus australis]|uniref:Cytochrome P450 n=1 Tax=Dryococelus australis TaxID=614101 RepID=A0ABQ9GGP8_9NEOP|nr:hypothetical protein PR048_027500 [Dryococelus australis]